MRGARPTTTWRSREPRDPPHPPAERRAPWVIQSVYLFDARRLLEDLRARGVRIRTGSSVRKALWTAAEVYPESHNAVLTLSQEQRDLLALFA